MAEEEHKPHKRHAGGHAAHGGGGHEEGHEGAPEWLISFADNVALMMGFFVILLAMNMAKATVGGGGEKGGHSAETAGSAAGVANADMIDFAIAMREAFNNPVRLDSTAPEDAALVARLRERANMGKAQDEGVDGPEDRVQAPRPNDFYTISAVIPFAADSAQVADPARESIRQAAELIQGMTLIVEIRAHCSRAEADAGAAHAMALSFQRARAVATELAAGGIDWWRMRLVLAGDHDRLKQHPRSNGDDAVNARVEILVTDMVSSSVEPLAE